MAINQDDVTKDIALEQLTVGMYVEKFLNYQGDIVELSGGYLLKDEKMLQQLLIQGVQRVFVNTAKGVAPGKDEVSPRSFMEPRDNAKELASIASVEVSSVMDSVRNGKEIDLAAISMVAEEIVNFLTSNQHTFLSVARLKNHDLYTFQHSVSVSALVGSFASALGYNDSEIVDITVGGLLHDIGKAKVPLDILNKPAKLDDKEFAVMRQHAAFTNNILQKMSDFPNLALNTAIMHHERPDGKGYPFGLKGKNIPKEGRMSAIIDVYDALTSVRVYKDSWEPTETLRRMMSWGAEQFDISLLQKFIKMMGVYPAGSFVLTRSNQVGLVVDQNEDLTRPTLNIIFDVPSSSYTEQHSIDLSIENTEYITSAITPGDYNISASNFL